MFSYEYFKWPHFHPDGEGRKKKKESTYFEMNDINLFSFCYLECISSSPPVAAFKNVSSGK